MTIVLQKNHSQNATSLKKKKWSLTKKRSMIRVRNILLSKYDHERLKEIIREYETLPACSRKDKGKVFISVLRKNLKKAQILEASDLRLLDVVGLNTSVRFKNLSTTEVKEYLIVHPKLECINLGRLSVLSDFGAALIGHKKWEIVNIKKANGPNYKCQILDIHLTSQEWIKRLEKEC